MKNELQQALRKMIEAYENLSHSKSGEEHDEMEREISLVRQYITHGEWLHDNSDQIVIYTGYFEE